jgi:hypothetical protein
VSPTAASQLLGLLSLILIIGFVLYPKNPPFFSSCPYPTGGPNLISAYRFIFGNKFDLA